MKTTLTTIILALIFINVNAQAPNWAWAKSAGGNGDDWGTSTTTDPFGNVFVTGFYTDTITFGSFTLFNEGNKDMFIVKYDATGNVLWANGAGGSGEDKGTSIATDSQGNVYVTGIFAFDSIAFGGFTLINSGSISVFIVKYDANGNVLWAKSNLGAGNNQGKGICTDASGNVYITGFFSGSYFLFGSDTLYNSPGNFNDMFIVKFDASGNTLWAKSEGGSQSEQGLSTTTDPSGNVYVTGVYVTSSMTVGTYTLVNSGVDYNLFIVKYDSSGNVVWAKSGMGSVSDWGFSPTIDASGNVYITGYYNSPSITFGSFTLTNAGLNDIFVVKYDASGNVQWAKQAGGNSYDFCLSASADANGINLTGYFGSPSITFGATTLTNINGGYDMFIVKYDFNGNIIWADGIGATSGAIYATCINSDPTGNLYITGYYNSSSITFGATTLSAVSDYDMFISKLVYTEVGINNVNNQNGINIYPNPTSGIFTIQNSNLRLQSCIIKNLLGAFVYTQKSNLSNQIKIDLSTQPKGIYFVEITDINNNYLNKKIIIE